MKLGKRLLVIAAAIILLVSLTGCSGVKNLDAIKKSGKIIMATNAAFQPYEYIENGKVVGFDVELANAIAEKLGVELEVLDIDFDSVITSVQSGKADMALAGLTITDERKKLIDFSDSYITATQVIIVPEGSAIASAADLDGKKVGVQLGTTGDLYISDPATWLGLDIKCEVQQYKKGSEAILELLNGKLDAVVIDDQPAKKFVEQNTGLKVIDEALTEEQYAVAVSKGNKELLAAVNEVIAELKANGKFDALLAEYIQ
jgi:polar amino acid transport system substrate-binding protein